MVSTFYEMIIKSVQSILDVTYEWLIPINQSVKLQNNS